MIDRNKRYLMASDHVCAACLHFPIENSHENKIIFLTKATHSKLTSINARWTRRVTARHMMPQIATAIDRISKV